MSDSEARLRTLHQAATLRYRNGEFSAAEALIAEALRLAPQSAELWSNRGTLQVALNNREAALVSFNRALQLKPGFPGAMANRAHILFELRRFADAAPDYERLLLADPQYAYALGNLVFCKLQCCDWRDLDLWRQRVLGALRDGKRTVPPVLSLAMLDSLADQCRAAEIMARDKLAPGPALWRGDRYRHDRIRLAYLSADFHSHATAVLAAGLFESHDRSRFETIAISFGPDDATPMRTRLKGGFERFIDVRAKSEAEIARLVRELEVDIAVDLKGYTSDARPAIFSQRPAPIQVNYLGFPGTMGAPFMDYLIADEVIVPSEDKAFYSEQIVWLPDTYQPNDRSRQVGAPIARASVGLPEQGFVFCCFNNSYKIQPPIFDIWMRLLRQVPGSVLWLLEDNPAATHNLRREAVSRGIDAGRLVFAGRLGQPEHMARHSLGDLFLDTLPYNAHTTASDALWMGLPIVTGTGPTFAGRVASSLLTAVGLPELITGTLDHYEALALRLARDPSALAAIKSKLAANRERAPLFDVGRFTRHLEAAYARMYESYMRGLPPAGFAVTAVMGGAPAR